MEWIERLNHCMNYIEEHLAEKIDYETLEEIMDSPVYHFQRMFFYITGISLTEYIRRRRMSLAAVELQKGIKVMDAALKYGYESPTAFNRAFQGVHGFPPSHVKKGNVELKSYPAIRFSLSVHGMEELKFRVEKKASFTLVGKSCLLSRELEENFKNIPQEWNEALTDGTLAKLISLNDQEPKGLLGVSVHDDIDWKYYIAVSSAMNDANFEKREIPAATWAIFSGRGSNRSLQDLERRVITEWLPTSGYEYARIPDIEVYIKADPEDAIYEYWLPVIKRSEDINGNF